MTPVAHRRAILAVLEAHGPLLPAELDTLTGLAPSQRAVAIGDLWRGGQVGTVERPERGPVRWTLVKQADLHADGQTANVPTAPGTAVPDPAASGGPTEEERMSDQGVWTNRETGGAVLATSNDVEGIPSWDVYVQGAKGPIPVIAMFESQIEPVITANKMVIERIEAATRPHLPGATVPSTTTSEEKTVSEQIAEKLNGEENDPIDAVLDSAAKGEGTKADAAAPRQAKPDPKPAGKAPAKAKAPAKGAAKAKAAPKGKAPAAKTQTRAETTRKAQAEKRTPAKAKTAKAATNGDKEKLVARAAELWKDSQFAADAPTATERRRAVRDALNKEFKTNTSGKVMGFLGDAGINGKELPAATK